MFEGEGTLCHLAKTCWPSGKPSSWAWGSQVSTGLVTFAARVEELCCQRAIAFFLFSSSSSSFFIIQHSSVGIGGKCALHASPNRLNSQSSEWLMQLAPLYWRLRGHSIALGSISVVSLWFWTLLPPWQYQLSPTLLYACWHHSSWFRPWAFTLILIEGCDLVLWIQEWSQQLFKKICFCFLHLPQLQLWNWKDPFVEYVYEQIFHGGKISSFFI